jgi:hypothetical protein
VTDDLVEWLRLQLDEDERIALCPRDRKWMVEPWTPTEPDALPASSWIVAAPSGDDGVAVCSDHIIRWDPARVLREVEAKRKIIDDLSAVIADDEGMGYYSDGHSGLVTAKRTPRLLALPCSDRPGFREEWRA